MARASKMRIQTKRALVEAIEGRLLMSAGQLDGTWGNNAILTSAAPSGVPIASAIAVGVDGRQVISKTYGPSATASASSDTTVVTRLDQAGVVDTTFGNNGTVTLAGELVKQVLIQGSAAIDLVGSKLQQLTYRGTVDSSFAGGGTSFAGRGVSAALQTDGKIVVSVVASADGSASGIYRFKTDGSIDTSFGSNGIASPLVSKNMGIAIGSVGNIIVAGGNQISKISPSGAPVTDYGTNGVVTLNLGAATLIVENNARVALTSDGSIEQVFDITAGGNANGYGLLAVTNPNGSQETVINLPTFGVVRGLAVQADGKVLVLGGSFTSETVPDTQAILARFNPVSATSTSVTYDTTFNGNGGVGLNFATHIAGSANNSTIDDQPTNLAIGPNGSMFFTGTTIDPGFGVNEFFTTKIQPDPTISYGRGAITGQIFSDTNSDGIRQSTEPVLPLYGAFLDNNNDGVFDAGDIRVVSDASGTYSFNGLLPGTYHVVEIPPTGYVETTFQEWTIDVTAGSVTNGTNFGLALQTTAITGTIFNDTDGNGTQDSTEIGLSGFTVYLDTNNNGVFDSGDVQTTSNASGTYSFSNIAAGIYHLRQTVPAGYTLSTPASFPVTLTVAANTVSTVNFGEVSDLNKFTGSAIGTAGSYNSIGNTIAKAVDDSVSTFFDAPTASGSWVGLDLGTPKVVTQVLYAPRANFAARMVGGVFQGSNSATFSSGVVTLSTITATPQVGVLTPVSFTNTTAYRYYRYLGPDNTYSNIAELAFYG